MKMSYSHVPNCRGGGGGGGGGEGCYEINKIKGRDHNKRGGLV